MSWGPPFLFALLRVGRIDSSVGRQADVCRTKALRIDIVRTLRVLEPKGSDTQNTTSAILPSV